MILVLINHLELTTESKSNKLSIIRFCKTVRLGATAKANFICLLDYFLPIRLGHIRLMLRRK